MAAEKADEEAREARQKERAEVRQIETEVGHLTDLMRELDQEIRMLTAGTLLVAGFHQHRGTWRKRRVGHKH